MGNYFVTMMFDSEPTLIETTNLARLLKKILQWAKDGSVVSNVTIKRA